MAMACARVGYLLALFCGLSLTHGIILNDHKVKYKGDDEVFEGDPFKISCILPVQDPGQWTVNSSEIIPEENDKGYTLSKRLADTFHAEMTLKVKSAQLYQEGEYRCNKYSRDFHYVRVVPGFSDAHEDDDDDDDEEEIHHSTARPSFEYEHLLNVNKTYEFFCASAKDDNTPLMWYKDGNQIISNSNSNVQIFGRTLFIQNAQKDDAGKYMCIVGRQDAPGLPELGRVFHLNSPAEVIDITESVNVIKDSSLVLHCKAQGFPQPKISWIIGNLNAFQSNKTNGHIKTWMVSSAYKTLTNLYLKIGNVSVTDRGLYTCRAENSVDSGATLEYDEESVFVHVRENMLLPNEDEAGRGKVLTPGETLLLHCNTTECQNCTVIWFKDGEKLHNNADIKIYEKNNSVVINNPSYNDSGIYMCAIDRQKLDIALNATINVQSKIKLDKFESSSFVAQGSPLELYCNAKAGPNPYIKWFIGDEEIDENERIKLLDHDGLKKGKLYIEEVDFPDRNHYTCEAYNQIDSVNTTTFLRVKDKLAALWPFLGICAEVAILCTIIFVYERRKSMTECDEPDTDLPSDNKPQRDQKSKGQDIRQRK